MEPKIVVSQSNTDDTDDDLTREGAISEQSRNKLNQLIDTTKDI